MYLYNNSWIARIVEVKGILVLYSVKGEQGTRILDDKGILVHYSVQGKQGFLRFFIREVITANNALLADGLSP